MSGFIEAIYIDSEDGARKTNVGAAGKSFAETRSIFEAARQHEVAPDKASFLLDLYDEEDDLVDTILLDTAGFHAVTGKRPLSESEYLAIDKAYWHEARRERNADRALRQTGEEG